MFLSLDISIVFCVYFIFLWTLKFFYLGHVKKSQYNTILQCIKTLENLAQHFNIVKWRLSDVLAVDTPLRDLINSRLTILGWTPDVFNLL